MSGPDDQIREMLGAFALGHLSDAETAMVQAHLDGCDACRAELDEIAPVARALGTLGPGAFEAPAAPPPGLGEQIRAEVAAERRLAEADELAARRDTVRRQRRGRGLVVAAAAVVVVAAVGGGVLAGRASAPEPVAAPPKPFEAITLTDVGADDLTVESAGLVPHTWGTELKIVGEGFDEGETFRASFRTDGGGLTPAGEFRGVGTATMTCNLQSAALRDDVTAVVIKDADGSTVLRSRL